MGKKAASYVTEGLRLRCAYTSNTPASGSRALFTTACTICEPPPSRAGVTMNSSTPRRIPEDVDLGEPSHMHRRGHLVAPLVHATPNDWRRERDANYRG
jgi:hypothetical protein